MFCSLCPGALKNSKYFLERYIKQETDENGGGLLALGWLGY